jgi:hypothetical protein
MTQSFAQIKADQIKSRRRRLKFIEMLQSTLWAALWVQQHENYERDFSRGHWLHFVFAGLAFSAFSVGLLIGIVHIVLANL